MTVLVTVLPHKAPLPGSTLIQIPIVEALETEWATDVHLQAFTLPDRPVRLTKKEGHDKANPTTQALFFDLDGPDHQADDDWKWYQIETLGENDRDLYFKSAWYHTAHGVRFVWTLDRPVSISEHKILMRVIEARLIKIGLKPDDKCYGWTHIFRAPFVVRDRVAQDLPANFENLTDLCVDDLLRDAPPPKEKVKEKDPSPFAGIGELKPIVTQSIDRTFPVSSRNSSITKLAGRFRYFGHSEEEIRAFLLILNQSRCNPPLDDLEVERIASSISGHAPNMELEGTEPPETPPPIFLERLDEATLAEYLTTHIKGDRDQDIVSDAGSIWRYNNQTGIWDQIDKESGQVEIMGFSGRLQMVDSKGKVQPLNVSAKTTHAVWELANALKRDPGWLSGGTPGVATSNGFLTDDGLLPHDPSHRATWSIPFSVEDTDHPELWLRSLKEMNLSDEAINLLGEFIGACIMGTAPKYQTALLMLGEGSNGKSVVMDILCGKDGVDGLFPSSVVTSIAPQELDSEYRRANLVGSRLNLVAELSDKQIDASDKLKAVISGDLIDARPIREAPFSFRPQAGHIFAANTPPAGKDSSPGFWRRWRVITFSRTFTEAEADRDRASKILRSERGAIVAWALRCYRALKARGHYEQIQDPGLHEWKVEAIPVLAWAEELFTGDQAEWTSATALFQDFRRWAMKHNRDGMFTSNAFGRALNRMGIQRKRTKDGWAWQISRDGRREKEARVYQ